MGFHAHATTFRPIYFVNSRSSRASLRPSPRSSSLPRRSGSACFRHPRSTPTRSGDINARDYALRSRPASHSAIPSIGISLTREWVPACPTPVNRATLPWSLSRRLRGWSASWALVALRRFAFIPVAVAKSAMSPGALRRAQRRRDGMTSTAKNVVPSRKPNDQPDSYRDSYRICVHYRRLA